jgi:hypothetical protein
LVGSGASKNNLFVIENKSVNKLAASPDYIPPDDALSVNLNIFILDTVCIYITASNISFINTGESNGGCWAKWMRSNISFRLSDFRTSGKGIIAQE